MTVICATFFYNKTVVSARANVIKGKGNFFVGGLRGAF